MKLLKNAMHMIINYETPRNPADLLEEILRDKNNYAKGYMKMWEVRDDINQPAVSLG